MSRASLLLCLAACISITAVFVAGGVYALPPRDHPSGDPGHIGTISFSGDTTIEVLQGSSFTVPPGTVHASPDRPLQGAPTITYEFGGLPTWITRSDRTLKVSASAPAAHSATVSVHASAKNHGAIVAVGSASYVITVLGNYHPTVTQLRPTLYSIDMSIGVGDHHILAGDYNNFDLYAKSSRTQVSLSGTDLASDTATSQLAIENGGAANLMRNRWTGNGRNNVNIGRFPKTTDSEVTAGKAIACDPANPAPRDSSGDNILLDAKGYPTSACINDFYDTRTTYDKKRNRFWIVTHGRNKLSASADCDANAALCKAQHKEATRITFAAVSKAEDPTQGFHTFKINEDYEDFPIMVVHDQYAIFHHHYLDGEGVRTAGKIWLYDADQMADGKLVQIKPALDASDFASPYIRVAKHHGTLDDLTFLVAASGSQFWVYGLPSPSGTTHGALLKSKSPYQDPGNASISMSEVVYRSGNLYIAGNDDENVLVWRVPLSLSGDKKQIVLDTQNAKKWTLKGTRTRDYVTIDVNKDEDVVVSFRAYDTSTPTRVRYVILYHGDSSFRDSVELTTPSSGSSGGRIDLVTSAVDPSDDETIWFITRDASGALIATVHPR
jgi:hypothetical protein